MTIAAVALFAGVSQGVVDRWERGQTEPREALYWQLIEVLQRLERGETIVLTAKRSKRRGGGVLLATHLPGGDLSDMEAVLDEIAREED